MILAYIYCDFSRHAWLTIGAGVGFFLAVSLLLVIVLLVAKRFLVQTGDVTITVNGDRKITTEAGKSLLSTMADSNVFLRLAAEKAAVANAGCRCLPAVASRCPPRLYTLHAAR